MLPRSLLPLALASVALACGGSPPPPASPEPAAPSPPPAPAPVAAAPAPAPAPAPVDPLDAPYDDAETDPTTLTPLFEKAHRPTFPKATGSEGDCWQTLGLVGDAPKDYEALAARCGAPTGAAPYSKPSAGKLHSVKDKRDTYLLHLYGGLCYRFFGVADGSIKNLDILILQKNGALVGDDKTSGPIAIIDSDKAWCMDKDVDYQFAIEVHGSGTGRYLFGTWARPK